MMPLSKACLTKPPSTLGKPVRTPRSYWRGKLFDGKTPLAHGVKVYIHPDALVLQQDNGQEERWPWKELRLLQGLEPGEHVRISRGDALTAPTLVVKQVDFLNAVHRAAPQANLGKNKTLGRLGKISVAAFAGGLIFVLGLYHWGIPALADQFTQRVPIEWEEKLGSELMANPKRVSVPCASQDKQRIMNKLFERVRRNSHSPYSYRVLLVHGASMNAFAAPGGHIVVYETLVHAMPTPDALAGVLAHEMQHVERRHGTRALLRGISGQLLLTAMFGDAGSLGQIINLGATLDDLAYDRAAEREADQQGLQQMIRAGLNPRGMAQGFEALAAEQPLPKHLEKQLSWLSTHPTSEERLRAIARALKSYNGLSDPALSASEWRMLSKPCSSQPVKPRFKVQSSK
jgi:Zn-dependent protease with chaperone function